jgi:hypothetical protein
LEGHRYRMRKMDKYFDNNGELHSTPPSGNNRGHRVFEIVKNINFVFVKKTKDGKTRKDAKPALGAIFKKKSIFFEYLPYWKEFDVQHAINGMHVQKNVFESIIGTLLDIKGKTKEGLNSRVDMVNLGIQKKLHPVLQENGKYHLPAASYNLNVDEKQAMCVWLKNLRVPSGFCSSIRSIVSMKDLTVTNYNSHDCHVMLTTFLPIANRAINPLFLKMEITRLCYFFNRISQKVIDRDELASLQEFTVETISQFEMCFPPSFFDIMVHLVVHLVPQIEALDPVGVKAKTPPFARGFRRSRWSDRDKTGRDTLRSIRHQTKACNGVIPQCGLVQLRGPRMIRAIVTGPAWPPRVTGLICKGIPVITVCNPALWEYSGDNLGS